MSIKIKKVADIAENELFLISNSIFKCGDVAAILTNLEPIENFAPECVWQIEIILGEGKSARKIMLDLPGFINKQDYEQSKQIPIYVVTNRMIYFRNRLFMPERSPKNKIEIEETLVRAKKIVYDEEAEVVALRREVANIEAAIEYQKSGSNREAIPEDVKLLVWTRDGGTCTLCGSNNSLHFDHIIPVSKGGGNSSENIQILCQICNLKKSDKISVMSLVVVNDSTCDIS